MIQELIGRVEKATGPERKLDVEIHATIFPEDFGGSADHYLAVGHLNIADLQYLRGVVPKYSASIDAAKTFKDKLLPGQAMAMGDMAFTNHPRGPWATIWTLDGSPQFHADAANPALAIILATLRALQEQAS